MNMGGQIGGAVTGSLTPWIASRYGWTASFMVAAALCLLGALSWLMVNPLNTLTEVTLGSQQTNCEHNAPNTHAAPASS
jgi:ACS family glucarate transporter-like MFS transporter